MKKTHRHDVLSDRTCSAPGCKKRLKLRLIEQRPNTHMCYEHCQAKRVKQQAARSEDYDAQLGRERG